MLLSCSNEKIVEEAIRLKLPNSQELLAKELENKTIPYRMDDQNRIWYPVSYAKEINKISSKILAELSPVISAVFPDKKSLNIAKKRFDESSIPYTLEESEYGTFIYWNENNAVKGTAIVNEILSTDSKPYNKSLKFVPAEKRLHKTPLRGAS